MCEEALYRGRKKKKKTPFEERLVEISEGTGPFFNLFFPSLSPSALSRRRGI